MLFALFIRLRDIYQTNETFDFTVRHNSHSQVIFFRFSAVSLIFINYANFREAVQSGLAIFSCDIALTRISQEVRDK